MVETLELEETPATHHVQNPLIRMGRMGPIIPVDMWGLRGLGLQSQNSRNFLRDSPRPRCPNK